jgi:uncharacterized protein YjdB
VNPVTAISGPTSVCKGQTIVLSDAAEAGTWSSSPVTVATIGSTGIVTGVASGLNATVTYTFCTGCKTTTTITVKALSPITGATSVCQGQAISLSDATGGGTWASSNGNASAGSAGLITGLGSGTVVISYILPTGCVAVATETVNPLTPITGPLSVCVGKTILLSDGVGGGSWSSSSPSIASIVAGTGVVTGVGGGLQATISYTLGTGCRATKIVSVIAAPGAPAAITGPSNVSISGSPVTLSDATAGGKWTSGNTLKAIVGSATGTVTGVSTGTVVITYTVSNVSGCTSFVTKNMTVGATPPPANMTFMSMVTVGIGSSVYLSEPGPGGSWNCNDCNGILQLDNTTGMITGLEQGRATLSYTLNTDAGPSLAITKVIVSNDAEGVNNPSGKLTELSLMPNPNKGAFVLKGYLGVNENTDVNLEVTDLLGQIVYKNKVSAIEGKINENIYLTANLANGMYILSLHSDQGTFVFHFVVEQ